MYREKEIAVVKVKLNSFPSVQLAVHGLGRYRVVNTVQQAVETLLNLWPTAEGSAYTQAIDTCVDAINGKKTPECVRQALIQAAQEAEIDVRE